MTVYKVAGPVEVAGTQPGGQVDLEDLEALGVNVHALVTAGHLEEVKATSRRKKAANDEEAG